MKGENAASERGMCASNKHADKRREIQQDVTEPLTKFSLQRPRNCSNFCAMRSCALPTALRIVPNTAHTHNKKKVTLPTVSTKQIYARVERCYIEELHQHFVYSG